ncbi:hypothetical protein [Streptosporangium sp. NPDC000396]|uniref:hypothetical protein n=1 Tax=Streptosporangium sp. NPDC000396 TaxID=3366185 RepID=UPI0036835AFA
MISPANVGTPVATPLAPPAPRWARWAAHLAALAPLPSGLWRLALALGFTAGYTEQGYADLGITGWGVPYVIALSVLNEAAALLTLGLVQPWGEVAPRWIPFIGGKTVRPMAAVIPAAIGATILIFLWTPFLFWWTIPHDDMTPIGNTVAGFLYLPLVAWGPLLVAVVISYYRRRRGLTRG